MKELHGFREVLVSQMSHCVTKALSDFLNSNVVPLKEQSKAVRSIVLAFPLR